MRSYIFIALLLFCGAPSFSQKKVDIKHEMDTSTQNVRVLVFLGTECPISQQYTQIINKLNEVHKTDNIEFIGIFSVQGITESEVASFVDKFNIEFEVIVDSNLAIAKQYKAKVTPEAFLINGEGTILYSGAIDNWYYELGKKRSQPTERYLSVAINQYSNGLLFFNRQEPIGCIISYSSINHEKHH